MASLNLHKPISLSNNSSSCIRLSMDCFRCHRRCLTSARQRHYSRAFNWLPFTMKVFHLHLTTKAFPMKKPISAFILITALLFAATVCAEIYKYTDENGQKRWTDDLSQVPKEQRAAAQRIESEEEKPADATAGNAQRTQPPPPSTPKQRFRTVAQQTKPLN